MKAHLEWKVAVIRTGEAFEKYGDPYEFVCVITREGSKGHISGAAGKHSRQAREAIETEIIAHGIEEVTWERVKTTTREVRKVV